MGDAGRRRDGRLLQSGSPGRRGGAPGQRWDDESRRRRLGQTHDRPATEGAGPFRDSAVSGGSIRIRTRHSGRIRRLCSRVLRPGVRAGLRGIGTDQSQRRGTDRLGIPVRSRSDTGRDTVGNEGCRPARRSSRGELHRGAVQRRAASRRPAIRGSASRQGLRHDLRARRPGPDQCFDAAAARAEVHNPADGTFGDDADTPGRIRRSGPTQSSPT